jgi:hypothetical protein
MCIDHLHLLSTTFAAVQGTCTRRREVPRAKFDRALSTHSLIPNLIEPLPSPIHHHDEPSFHLQCGTRCGYGQLVG